MAENGVRRGLRMGTGHVRLSGKGPEAARGGGAGNGRKEKPGGGTPGRNKKRIKEGSMTHLGEIFKPLPALRPLFPGWENAGKARAAGGVPAGIRAGGGKGAGFGGEGRNG